MTIPANYYFPWEGVEDFSEYQFDEKGRPLVNYGKKIGFRYNPITIAQYGLFNISQYLKTKSAKNRQLALLMADWLLNNWTENEKKAAVWIYEFDLDFYGISGPWISAMAQGEAISLLLRAHQFHPEPHYLKIAEKAVQAFRYPIFEGGVCSTFADGSLSLEEFPSDPPSHVLNGTIFALLGMYDYLLQTNDQSIARIYDAATAGLKCNLHRYDMGYWTLYELYPTRRLTSRLYQLVHVRLMQILWKITGDEFYKSYAHAWNHYYSSKKCQLRWLTGKMNEKARLFIRRRWNNAFFYTC